MTKSRGRYKPRDKDETMAMLLKAVGDILREEGYQGLGVNKVAARAGVHKKNIYNYFGTYNELLKAYIKSKDFWTPVFEKFQLSDSPVGDELQDFIICIFQEQFKYFFSEPEMQAFIHWQVSESNSVLRQVSEEREFEGAKIAALAVPHFKGSGYSLRATLALILGGIHYVVWHADKNKSVVCGLDINIEEHREELIETISDIIALMWEAAGKRKKDN